MGLATKPDERDRRSQERDGPSSDRPAGFKSAANLIEPLVRTEGMGVAVSPMPPVPASGVVETRVPINEERPDSEPPESVCHPPDEVYIRDCYRRMLELRDCTSKAAVVEGINSILEEMADKAQREDSSYTVMVNGALMHHWTRKEGNSTSYDEFMQKHVDAISVLMKAWMRDKQFSGKKIKVLEASCGTGAVLEAFLDALPPRMLRKLRIVANDVSSAAIETTRKRMEKYAGKVRIEYSQKDLTEQIPNGKFDLVLLSQTLPFLNDENALRAQRLGLALPSESRHITAKRKVLESLVNRLKPGKGHFLLIDEHPMRLSKIPDDFDSILDSVLFNEIFRPISRGTLINDVMKRIDARFKEEEHAFIDREHLMYSMDFGAFGEMESPVNAVPGACSPEDGAMRKDPDVENIVRRAEVIHKELIGHLQSFEEESGTVYRPISVGEKRLEIDKEYYDERIEHKVGYWRTNGNYNLVILNGLVHHVGQEGYRCLIEKLKKSHKVGPGSAILFIDEWPAPAGSPNPVGNGDARSLIFNAFDDQVFCGSIRSGNKYGYLYVVRNL